jgi:hypothetical protein
LNYARITGLFFPARSHKKDATLVPDADPTTAKGNLQKTTHDRDSRLPRLGSRGFPRLTQWFS